MIDGADGGIGIGIRSEQCALRGGKDFHRLLQELHPIHTRHALVGQQQGHAVITHLQLLKQIKRTLGGIASDHTVGRAVLRAKIALDRPQNIRVVIHAQQDRFRHAQLKPQART